MSEQPVVSGRCEGCRLWFRGTHHVYAADLIAKYAKGQPRHPLAGTTRWDGIVGWGECRYASRVGSLMAATCDSEGISGELKTAAGFGCTAFESLANPDEQERTVIHTNEGMSQRPGRQA